MGGKSPSPPPAPSPQQTAAASTSTNVGTSIANAFLNNTNQITPDGELRYDVTGNYTWNDPYTNLSVNIPTFTATQIRSPQAQAIEDQSQAAKFNLAGMANTQSARLSNLLANDINLAGAPAAGDPNLIGGVGQAATTFGDAGSQQSTFGDAGDITRSYGPADNFSADRQRVEQSLFDRLNPQLDRQKQQLEQQLQDQGIRYGSPAYTAAMDNWNRQANDLRLGVTAQGGAEQQRMMDMAAQQAGFQNAAQQQAFTEAQTRGTFANQAQQETFRQGAARADFANAGLAQQVAQAQSMFNAQNMTRNQFMNEQYALRNQPINEVSSLLSGSQINNPNFVNTPNNQIPTTDVAGLINNRFSQDMQIYQQESQNNNAMMGGIFGLMGGLLKGGMALSDERAKEDAIKIGSVYATNPDNDNEKLPIYEYNYKPEIDPTRTRRVGPMAQDVAKIDPSAVKTRGGLKHIDVTKLGSILRVA